MALSITFVLPGHGRFPVGGMKIVYEYANRLCAKGWRVNIIHPAAIDSPRESGYRKSKHYIRYLIWLVFKLYLPSSWFTVAHGVRLLWVPNLLEKQIPDADYIVACPAVSAFSVNSYSPRKGRKFYFIQHFEDWSMKKEDVEKTWKLPLKKIVVSQWLKSLAHTLGEEAVCIPNGLDFTFFRETKQFHERPFRSILFISHTLDIKGTRYCVEACDLLKKKYPDITITTFSRYHKPAGFPLYITYYCNPSQEQLRELYNSSAIYISASLSEGWDLPLCEAILCGCVAVATDINGHREYLQEGVNGFYCKPASAESIVDRVEYVLTHPNAARALSETAHQTLKQYDWDSRVRLFEEALLSK
jgi:glycosyltransferase involved in cell wall biosynthesis